MQHCSPLAMHNQAPHPLRARLYGGWAPLLPGPPRSGMAASPFLHHVLHPPVGMVASFWEVTRSCYKVDEVKPSSMTSMKGTPADGPAAGHSRCLQKRSLAARTFAMSFVNAERSFCSSSSLPKPVMSLALPANRKSSSSASCNTESRHCSAVTGFMPQCCSPTVTQRAIVPKVRYF